MPGPDPNPIAKVVPQTYGVLVPIPKGMLDDLDLDDHNDLAVRRELVDDCDHGQLCLTFEQD